MKWFAFIGIFVLLFSCKSSDEQDVIDIRDVIPQAEKDYEVEGVQEASSDLSFEHVLVESYPDVVSVEAVGSRLFPDRFGTDTSYHFRAVIADDTISYHKWVYSDSLKTVNAFYNWIDCFGSNCRSFFVGAEQNMQQEAMFLSVNDTCMIYVTGNRIDHNKWLEHLDDKGHNREWSYYVEQRKRGSARWYHFKNKKRIKYLK